MARIEEQQRQRCSQCTEKCQMPLPACTGRATWREIVMACLPTASVMLACGAIALLTGLVFQARP